MDPLGALAPRGTAAGEFADTAPDALADRLLAMLDGLGIRALVRDPAVPLESAAEVWRVLAYEVDWAPRCRRFLGPIGLTRRLRATPQREIGETKAGFRPKEER